MAIVDVKVPQLSESVAEATLLQWKKKSGEPIAADEILIELKPTRWCSRYRRRLPGCWLKSLSLTAARWSRVK